MNVTALITAALTAVAEFFGWRREEAKGDKARAETLAKSQQALESEQQEHRTERQQLEHGLKQPGRPRNDMEDDW